jgi:hypothetical protein
VGRRPGATARDRIVRASPCSDLRERYVGERRHHRLELGQRVGLLGLVLVVLRQLDRDGRDRATPSAHDLDR